jgi:(2Fe-2S) ferredoxin
MDEQLHGTVKLYQRHLFVCTGRSDWAARIETDGGFLQSLADAIGAQAAAMPSKVKLTACGEPSQGPGYDVLIFPDSVRYLGVQEADIVAFVENHLVKNGVYERIPLTRLNGHHVFVCVHGARDPRCGFCGPRLIERFKEELGKRQLSRTVAVRETSHVGGDWYGYVTPDDVSRIIDQHLLGGRIVAGLWRGRIGTTAEEAQRLVSGWEKESARS